MVMDLNYHRAVNPIPEAEISLTVQAFLNLLARDMRERPELIRSFPVTLLERARSAAKGVEVDLDGPLMGDD